jgi:hypothetical protein
MALLFVASEYWTQNFALGIEFDAFAPEQRHLFLIMLAVDAPRTPEAFSGLRKLMYAFDRCVVRTAYGSI